MNRLVRKGALGFRKEGRAYLYHPRVTEEECVDAASVTFLDRVFGGSLKSMLVYWLSRKKLSPQEIRDLKRLLTNNGT